MQIFSDKGREAYLRNFVERESLFRYLYATINDVEEEYLFEKRTSYIENWLDAKLLVADFLTCSHPEFLVQSKVQTLSKHNLELLRAFREQGEIIDPFSDSSLNEECRQLETEIVILYSCVIIHYQSLVVKNEKLKKLLDKLAGYLNFRKMTDLCAQMCVNIEEGLSKGEIPYTYDYTRKDGKIQQERQTDWPAMVKQKEEEIAQLKQELEQLKQEHAQLKQEDEWLQSVIESDDKRISSKFKSQVQLELLRILFDRTKLKTASVKQMHLAKLMSFITGWKKSTCSNYLGSPGLKNRCSRKFLEEIQEELKVTGLDVSLEFKDR